MCFSGSPVCPAAAVCLSSVLPTRGTLQYVGDQQRKWGTWLQKFEQLTYRSGRLSPKIVLGFLCRSHYRKAGRFSVSVLDICTNFLKVDMWIEEYLSMERGR